MIALGLDIGSSSIKASLVDIKTGNTLATSSYPESEMKINAPEIGWAEQNPEHWWEYSCKAIDLAIQATKSAKSDISCIGISYQMHGLVMVDKSLEVIHPSIIWCDSRAVAIGDQAFKALGQTHCLSHYLNSPGNFTAAKLAWVKENKPEVYERIHKIMLPGDYIAMKLTEEISTTISGLSEGIFWDFKNQSLASDLLKHYGFDSAIFPEIKDTFVKQGGLSRKAAGITGLAEGTPISYRAGDQPNNALSLGVFEPGEIAATGGTSGVVYGVTDQAIFDQQSRINGFAHVNYQKEIPRIGLLLCINGAGILYAWLRKQIGEGGLSYDEMEKLIAEVPTGSEGLRIIPFGNGAERVINNKQTGAQINNLQFNVHTKAHLMRAGLEGIAFSFVYGIRILQSLGMSTKKLRVGNDNLFQSQIFSQTIANLVGATIEVVQTTGAIGAAKAAAFGAGFYSDLKSAVGNTPIEKTYSPEKEIEAHSTAYQNWENDLNHLINKS